MENIKTLLSLDVPQFILNLVLILLSARFVWDLVDWAKIKLGIELKSDKDKKETAELLSNVMDKVNKIDTKLETMNNRLVATEVATRVTLADKINSKYKEYLDKDGIPEDEVDEFMALHDAYKGVGGNHSSDIKFNYCMNNLSIIPCQNKAVMDKIKDK